jgi:chemotaxis family two-component system response regulator Rcp1
MPAKADIGPAIEILLVEDNPGDVRLTREVLSEGRIRNTLNVATDGVEALSQTPSRRT